MVLSRRALLLAVPASLVLAADRKKDQKGRFLLEIVDISVRRSAEEKIIAFEGHVRNSGERPIRRAQLIFHVLAPDGEEVSRQRGRLEPDPFAPGDEMEFMWQMRDHARAVDVRVGAEDGAGVFVDVKNPGPYAIE